MIGKNEQIFENNTNLDQIKEIANKRQLLQNNYAQVQEDIGRCFAQLNQILHQRQMQLLRQVEAVHTQQLSLIQTSLETLPLLKVNFTDKIILEEQIQNFGRIEEFGTNRIAVKDTEPYKVEYYQDADKDHVSFNKSINCESSKEKQLDNLKNISTYEISNKFDQVDHNFSSSSDSSLKLSLNNDLNFKHESYILQESLNASKDLRYSENLPLCSSLNIEIKPDILRKHTEIIESFENISFNPPDKMDTMCSNNLHNPVILISSNGEASNTTFVTKEIQEQTENCDNSLRVFARNEVCMSSVNGDCQEISNSSLSPEESTKSQEMILESSEHPKQVQQWLQQILVEPETEPFYEIEQFSEISEARFYNKFSVET
ncbi:uncharacterized protein [Prorops nasuta]|uniref:uncharacterized protein n=1 Tax=Prorops nasuta TaxID=863751 RepID=UPI0034CDED35